MDPITAPIPRPTIYGFLSSNDQFRILAAVVDALPNISTTFDEPGARFTLFAPSDSAFRDLARRVTGEQDAQDVEDVIPQIVDGIANLRRGPGFTDVRGILFYHVLQRHYTFAELEDLGTVVTPQGKNLTIVEGNRVRDADPSRDDANAFQRNIFTQNGWIHAIDSVLLPFDLERAIMLAKPSPSPALSASPDATATDPPTPTSDATPTDPTDPSTPIVPGPGDVPTNPSVSPDADTTASPDDDDDDGVCFPATARVHTPAGDMPMEQLEAGHEVLHHESGKSSKVFLFTHRTNAHQGVFYRITTSTGHAVTMTGNHYLYANGRLTAADAVVLGDTLRTLAGVSPVVKVEKVRATGLYAPHSMHGDLVVDGIVVSGYSRAVSPRVAHAVLAPVRWLVKATGVTEVLRGVLYEGGRGVEWYLPKGKDRY